MSNAIDGKGSIYKTLTVARIYEEAKDVKTFVFDEEATRKIIYQPGQYLTLVLPEQQTEVRRSYSISSTPVLNEPLSITVKRIENGIYSRYLMDKVKEGDTLITTGAGGLFTLPKEISAYKQFFFLAAGSGIVPIYSLLKTLLHSYPFLSIVLLYSNRSAEETIFRTPIEQLAQDFPQNFHLEILYGNTPDLSKARLYRESLVSLWKRYAIGSTTDTLFYLCGPLTYMRMCTYVLQGEGVPAATIKKENFNTAGFTPVKKEPTDKNLHSVTIKFGSEVYQLPVQYPATILQAAKAQGIALPYSCEVGRCGNCVAKCTKGTVWLSNNEVLTDKELATGLVLTCVGYPVNGDVVLEIQ